MQRKHLCGRDERKNRRRRGGSSPFLAVDGFVWMERLDWLRRVGGEQRLDLNCRPLLPTSDRKQPQSLHWPSRQEQSGSRTRTPSPPNHHSFRDWKWNASRNIKYPFLKSASRSIFHSCFHPEYGSADFSNDICLLRVDSMQMSNFVDVVCLPEPGQHVLPDTQRTKSRNR